MADSPERLQRVPEIIGVVPEAPDVPPEVKDYVQVVETEPQALFPTMTQQGTTAQPSTQGETLEIPYDLNTLTVKSKGKSESSGTWFAVEWIRKIKMAIVRGIRVLIKNPLSQPGS